MTTTPVLSIEWKLVPTRAWEVLKVTRVNHQKGYWGKRETEGRDQRADSQKKQNTKSAPFLLTLFLQKSQTIRETSLVFKENLQWFTSLLDVEIFLLHALLTQPIDTCRVYWNYSLFILNNLKYTHRKTVQFSH